MNIRIAEWRKPGMFPFGLTRQGECFSFCVVRNCAVLRLVLMQGEKRIQTIPFPQSCRNGSVWSMQICGISESEAERLSYCYEGDGILFADPYGCAFAGHPWNEGSTPVLFALLSGGVWEVADADTDANAGAIEKLASLSAEQANNAASMRERAASGKAVCRASDAALKRTGRPLTASDSIIYRLHVRGFTIAPSSGLKKKVRGTFDGVREKLPYLKELGITMIELMPCYEFEERLFLFDGRRLRAEKRNKACDASRSAGQKHGTSGVVQETVGAVCNYWGFTSNALRFAPKAAFGGAEGFERLIRAVHDAGMELVLDFYFDGTEPQGYVTDVLRHWRMRFGIDGAHIVGFAPLSALLADPYLRGMKLWADRFSEEVMADAAKTVWPGERTGSAGRLLFGSGAPQQAPSAELGSSMASPRNSHPRRSRGRAQGTHCKPARTQRGPAAGAKFAEDGRTGAPRGPRDAARRASQTPTSPETAPAVS